MKDVLDLKLKERKSKLKVCEAKYFEVKLKY